MNETVPALNARQSAQEADDEADPPGSDPSWSPDVPATELQYREIFNAVSDGLIINDLDTGLVLEANPAACRMHGYDDMTGLHPAAFIHPNSQHLFVDYVVALRAGEEYRCRAQDIRKDGAVIDVEVLGRPISYFGQTAMLGVVRDISDQVRAYQVLEQRVEERTAEIERRRRVAEGMRELIEVVNSRQALDEILGHLVDQARALLECDASAVFLPIEERGGELLAIRASSGLESRHSGVRMPLHGSSTGLAIARRKPVYVTNLRDVVPHSDDIGDDMITTENDDAIQVHRLPSALKNPERDPGADPEGGLAAFASAYGAILAIPMISKETTHGTLSLYYRDPREFSHDDLSLAGAFAGQAALALENASLREQAGQAAVLEERQRLARELHDAVTQTLFSASLISEVIPDLWETNPDDARSRLDQLRKLTRSALAEMRLLLLELRPTALTDIPLTDLLRQLVEATTGTTHAEFKLDIKGDTRMRIGPDTQIGIYRIAQEALNNIAKHAQARNVEIVLDCTRAGCIDMLIRDDGHGFDPARIPAGHLGVGIMHERAAAIGARIQVQSAPECGTLVKVRWRNREETRR